MAPWIDQLLQCLDHPVICLNYRDMGRKAVAGVGAEFRELDIRPSGMSFCSCWGFELGTEISISWEDAGLTHSALGVVVSCEKTTSKKFRTTLFFLDKNQPAGRNAQRV